MGGERGGGSGEEIAVSASKCLPVPSSRLSSLCVRVPRKHVKWRALLHRR